MILRNRHLYKSAMEVQWAFPLRIFLCLILLVGISEMRAQEGPMNLSDSMKVLFSAKPGFFGKYDTRNSFVTGKSVRVRGVKAGVTFTRRLKLGVGYSWLKSDLVSLYELDDKTIESRLHMHYFGLYGDYIFYLNKRWEFSIPVLLSVGKDWYEATDSELGLGRYAEGWIVLYEPAMAFEYLPFPYLGLGAGIGFRLMLWNNKEIDQRLNSPTYLIKINLRLGELYKDFK